MSNKRGSAPVLECPSCHKPMAQGTRVRCTFSWEGARVIKRRWNYMEHRYEEKEKKDLKSITRLMCRECAEKAASMLGIERPEEVE